MSPTPDEIIAAIRNGDYDDDGILAIIDAIQPRFQLGAVKTEWTLEFPDLKITEGQLRLRELEAMERATKLPWTQFRLDLLLKRAEWWNRFLETLYISRVGLTPEEAEERVGNMEWSDIEQAMSEITVADPPKDSGT